MDNAEHMAHFDLEMTYRKRAHLRMSYAFHDPSLIRTPARGHSNAHYSNEVTDGSSRELLVPGQDLRPGAGGHAGDVVGRGRGGDGEGLRGMEEGGEGGEKGGFILYLQSSCNTRSDRDAFVSQLMRFVKVSKLLLN
jgi:hypothetical protein